MDVTKAHITMVMELEAKHKLTEPRTELEQEVIEVFTRHLEGNEFYATPAWIDRGDLRILQTWFFSPDDLVPFLTCEQDSWTIYHGGNLEEYAEWKSRSMMKDARDNCPEVTKTRTLAWCEKNGYTDPFRYRLRWFARPPGSEDFASVDRSVRDEYLISS